MMDRCLDTRKEARHRLEEYARQLLLFINQYEYLTHAYIVEFFKKDHWSSLPPKWQHCLKDLTPPEMAESIMADTTKTRSVWPLSLLAYKATAKSLSLPNVLASDHLLQQESGAIGDMGDLAFCYRLHVKPKKQHEIGNLGKIIKSTCQASNTKHVVDVGSGQGHLSRLLSFGHRLSVTSIEAVGCHITGAAKFDRKVQEFMGKKEKELPAPPEHVVCTVHPHITVEEFVSVIKTSCQQTKVEDTIVTKRDETSSTCDFKDTDSANKTHDLNGSNCDTRTPELDQDNLEKFKLAEEINTNDSTKSSFLLAGLHTCADLGPTMLRVFAKCPNAQALASVACCYMKMSCAVHNSLIKGKARLPQPDGSMQTNGSCADTSVNIGKFKSYPPRKLYASNESGSSENVALPNQDLQQESETVTVTQENGIPGFPMSEWVKGQDGCDLDFEPLELACHSFDVYHKRLKENDPNLILQGYRALLEIIIQQQNPSLVQKHPGLRLIKRALGNIKKGHQIPFEEYAATALKKLGLQYDSVVCQELRDNLLHQWPQLIAFHCVRLLMGPVIESLVLVDRMLFLLEQGIDSRLVPIFDPVISPRNFVLLATKR